jgi:hypothetical protein
MEPTEVTDEPIDQRVPACRSEVVPEWKGSRRGAVTEGISDISPLGIVPSDFVGDGIRKWEVLEGTTGDFIIVGRITVSTEPSGRGVIEDLCTGEVGLRICQLEYQYSRNKTISRTRQLTNGPVPVGLRSLVAALGLQSKFEVGDIGAMPRQEKAGEMDLGGEKIGMSQLIDMALARSADCMKSTYHRVQVHMGINKV